MSKKERIYIAGPEVFFANGDEVLESMRVLAESHGNTVTLPNDDPLNMTHQDLRDNAQEIFDNLENVMAKTSMLIADLDQFRGAEPDSGTIFEIGMAFARDVQIYGFARDTRPLVWKDQHLIQNKDGIVDEHGWQQQYSFLPFSPLVMATTNIVEGTFEDALIQAELDAYRQHTAHLPRRLSTSTEQKNHIFLAIRNYYDQATREEEYKKTQKLRDMGYIIDFPYFRNKEKTESTADWLHNLLVRNIQLIDSAEIFVADLNDFRGYECSNDVGFLSGYAFETGKVMYGYMRDTRPMIQKIPNTLKNGKYKDIANRDVENFNYPINLMFACSMKIIEGGVTELQKMLLKNRKKLVNE